jgi:hypothetical protein
VSLGLAPGIVCSLMSISILRGRLSGAAETATDSTGFNKV